MTTIVVARHGEDIRWTSQFENVIIYNKGLPLPGGGNYIEIPLPNVGKEGHTYYKHICDNYDNLGDNIVFVQGNPFDHSPNLVANIKSIKSTVEFEFLSEQILETNLLGCPHHVGIPMADVYIQIVQYGIFRFCIKVWCGGTICRFERSNFETSENFLLEDCRDVREVGEPDRRICN